MKVSIASLPQLQLLNELLLSALLRVHRLHGVSGYDNVRSSLTSLHLT